MDNLTDSRPVVVTDPRPVETAPRPVLREPDRFTPHPTAIVAPYGLPTSTGRAVFGPPDIAAGVVTILMICGPLLAGVLRVG